MAADYGGWAGEAMVMSVVVGRVGWAVAASGFPLETAGLLLLALASLSLQFFLSRKGTLLHLKSRVGTSLGLYLGALIVPLLLGSHLVHQQRLHNGRVDWKDVKSRLEFWEAFACSCGMLFYLLLSSCGVQTPSHLAVKETPGGNKLPNISHIYATVVTTSIICFFVPSRVAIVLLHAPFCALALRLFMLTFVGCTSFGEAMLLVSGFVVCFGNAVSYTICKGMPHLRTSFGIPPIWVCSKEDVVAITQGTLLCLIFLPPLYKSFLHLLDTIQHHYSKGSKLMIDIETLCKSTMFYAVLVFVVTILASGWLQHVHGLDQHLIIWVLTFMIKEPQRLAFCCYWLALLLLFMLHLLYMDKRSCNKNILRKHFHGLAVLMFLPSIIYQRKFTNLAFCVAFSGFLVLEMIRVWRIPPWGDKIHSFLRQFTDDRDSDALIISHFSLLLGCALPSWLSPDINDKMIAPLAGIVSVGIGDTMASIVGSKYGTLRLRGSRNKTLQGTLAGIASMMAGCLLIQYFWLNIGDTQWISLTLAVICTGLMEAYTAQLDNAFIPLIFFALLII